MHPDLCCSEQVVIIHVWLSRPSVCGSATIFYYSILQRDTSSVRKGWSCLACWFGMRLVSIVWVTGHACPFASVLQSYTTYTLLTYQLPSLHPISRDAHPGPVYSVYCLLSWPRAPSCSRLWATSNSWVLRTLSAASWGEGPSASACLWLFDGL